MSDLDMNGVKQVPTVMIVGGGLGGLMLAILLEQINIPYNIFERGSELRSYGGAMTIGASIFPAFDQLGMLGEIMNMSLDHTFFDIFKASTTSVTKLGSMDFRPMTDTIGYIGVLFKRPNLYKLLLKRVPANKIMTGKRVFRTEEKDGKVHIHCSDNTTYSGDILVGADGAYSAVRQSMYEQLADEGLLPSTDSERLPIAHSSVVGTTVPQDPEKYPQLKDSFSHFAHVLGEGAQSFSVCTLPGNHIAWILSLQLTEEQVTNDDLENSEWGSEAVDTIIKGFQDLRNPWGGSMKDLIDASPKESISKVFLEEKIFKTWHWGRTVLLGDACHKMHPAGGVGAVTSLQDAVVLANCIYNMTDGVSSKSITAAFDEYYRQRFHRARLQVESSKRISKIMVGQTWMDTIARNIMFYCIPNFMTYRTIIEGLSYRPQIAWLPLSKNPGTGYVQPQEGRRKLLNEDETVHMKTNGIEAASSSAISV